MNDTEFFGCLVAPTVAFTGALVGWFSYGFVGIVAGGVTGFIVGWIATAGIIWLFTESSCRRQRMEERRNLSKHFGAYWANERNDDWQNLVSRVNIGDSLQGKVVYQCYYGVFLDVGIGFPACLTKLNSSRPTCDPNPDLGAMLEVRVREVNSNEHIVDLAEIEEPGTTGS